MFIIIGKHKIVLNIEKEILLRHPTPAEKKCILVVNIRVIFFEYLHSSNKWEKRWSGNACVYKNPYLSPYSVKRSKVRKSTLSE
ncbi:unnamed protein product [Hermetia illucens]|uniref:Uncharacterized protein n=1 Tax=Hermetia illucens TaxID=343691 RepID=A0A7R8UY09_HERIL|nr:unnamed protein product [Hermetia illucens]